MTKEELVKRQDDRVKWLREYLKKMSQEDLAELVLFFKFTTDMVVLPLPITVQGLVLSHAMSQVEKPDMVSKFMIETVEQIAAQEKKELEKN